MTINPYSSMKSWLHYIRASNYYHQGDYSQASTEINQVQLHGLPILDISTIAILAQLDQMVKARAKLEDVLKNNPRFLENARPELEKFYLGDVDLIDMLIEGLNRVAI